jgi:transposase
VRRRHIVRLTTEQRVACDGVLADAAASGHSRRRALILLHADVAGDGSRSTDRDIAAAAGVSPRTVARVRAAFARHGFDAAMNGMQGTRRMPAKLTAAQEQLLLDLLDTPPPPSYPRWTTRTLAERLGQLDGVPAVSRELVRRTLKRHNRSLGHPLVAIIAAGVVDACQQVQRLMG